ncbi:hypothetical protein K1719_045129 [Acacia pycnantha]|nr:hypothetical protein K1719_045129 [Acacia pycnantha]
MQDKNALRVVEVLEQSTQRTMTVRGKAKGKTETAGKNNSAYQGGQEVVGTKSSVPIEKRRVDKRSREAVIQPKKQLCKESKPSLIILAETRTSDVSKFNCFRRLGYDSFRIIPSSGQSGGLAIGWMSSQINVSVVEEDRQFFHLSCQIPKIDPFFIIAVYAIPYANYEAALWECLSRISQDRINKCRLADMGAVGPKMTWKGPQLAGYLRFYERLDRVLSNSYFTIRFPDSYAKVRIFGHHQPWCCPF